MKKKFLIILSLFFIHSSYGKDEINAVQEVLQSGAVNYWTGKISKSFENEFANFYFKEMRL